MVSIVNYVLSKGSADNYEVNDAEKGKENNAFDDETKKTDPLNCKYVPQDMIPDLNGDVDVINEEQQW